MGPSRPGIRQGWDATPKKARTQAGAMRWVPLTVLAMLLLSGCASDSPVLPDPEGGPLQPAQTDDAGSGQDGNQTDDGNETVPGGNETAEGGEGNETVPGNQTGNGTAGPIFFDGAEGDASQWAITSNLYVNVNLNPPNGPPPAPQNPDDQETDEAHPDDAGWAIVADPFHAGAHSWGNTYPDNYRSRMTSSPLAIPAGGATLSYWVMGGAEDNTVDGIHVLVGETADALAEVAYHSGVIEGWTLFEVALDSLAGKTAVLQFRFDSDISCSNQSPPEEGGALCAPGWDAGGLFLDDILVA